jgi:hypothetical protein
MSDFDQDIREVLGGASGFDPNRARAAQVDVYQEYQKKMRRTERHMWSFVCAMYAVGFYALWGFILQATTIKEFVGYSMVIMFVLVFTILMFIMSGITITRLLMMKEIKQMRLALAGEAAPPNEPAAKPLRGLSPRERGFWVAGLIVTIVIASLLGTRTDRQDDFWRLGSGGRIEIHSVLMLHRLPHDVFALDDVEGPVESAVLQSATVNGESVSFEHFNNHYRIYLPCRRSWKTDKIELVWTSTLPAMQDYAAFRTPLRSLMPVHHYTLTLYVEDNSGFTALGDAWKRGKRPAELRNESEARRTLKCFTWARWLGTPRDKWGTCGLPIVSSVK